VIGVVVVTHGQLATELLNAAEAIVGDLPRFAAVSIGWHDDVDDARAEIQRAINRYAEAEGVLILTDMFGGTPTNLSLSCLEGGNIEIVTGVNLPMLIKLAGMKDPNDVVAVARELCETGRSAIHVATDLIRGDAKH